ncbi:hypothetical protein [Candidatus Poriferisodalis sp.]|uniref:hypothetical protein n=1 Tax=Candidatus Poriferisodalis sp. TaxID=3101277 RepID=UPI003B518266
MTVSEGRRRPKKLSAETKWEIYLQVAAASLTVVPPRTSCIQISYFSCGAKNRFLFTPGSVLNTTPQSSAENPPMLAETNHH